ALHTIENQRWAWQDGLRMARGRCHCKASLTAYELDMFWIIFWRAMLHRKCGRSIFVPALTDPLRLCFTISFASVYPYGRRGAQHSKAPHRACQCSKGFHHVL